MKQLLTLTSLLCLTSGLWAQRHMEVGLATGVTHYYGDLGNIDGPMQWNSTRPGMSITFRDFLNNKKRYVTRSLTTEVRLSWFRTGYDERAMIPGLALNDHRNYRRGLSFRNDLVGASGHLVLNAYREPYQPLFQQKFFMYFHIGLGVYHGRPKADLFHGAIDPANRYYQWSDGTVRDAPRGTPEANIIEHDGTYETDLYDWYTERVGAGSEASDIRKPSPWHIAVPLGVGVRYMLTRELSVGIEYSYLMFTNDRIDDVSNRYPTYSEIEAAFPNDPRSQELARYITDPTGWGSDGTTGIRTSRRGNPGLLDNLSFANIEVSYRFKRKPTRRSYVSL